MALIDSSFRGKISRVALYANGYQEYLVRGFRFFCCASVGEGSPVAIDGIPARKSTKDGLGQNSSDENKQGGIFVGFASEEVG